jgi:hypothetical protein
MIELLTHNNAAHANNIANLTRVESLVLAGRRVDAADLLLGFRWHERMRLRARAKAGLLAVQSPHEIEYRMMLARLREAIMAAMQGEKYK